MDMPDFGPVGGGVAAINNESPVVVETQSNHGLRDSDRVRIQNASSDSKPLLCYAKCSGLSANALALYSDTALKVPAQLNEPPAPGATVVRLASQDWAVVVGINAYPAFTSLKGPTQDATEFAQWLLSGLGACVPDDQLVLIRSPNYEAPPELEQVSPRLEAVKQAFIELARKASKSEFYRLGRRLYIFLAGHGILPTHTSIPDYDETALLMANADTITLGEHCGGHVYAEWFRALGAFDEVVLFVDCCRDQKDNIPLSPHPFPSLRPQRDPARRFYAAATKLDSRAWERSFGPATHGVFSYALLEALKNPTLCDAQGCLTGDVLAKYLYANIPDLKKGQEPEIHYTPARDILFIRRVDPKKPKARIVFAAQYRDKIGDVIGRKYPEPDATHAIDDQPWTVALDRYIYKVKVRGVEKGVLFEIDGSEEVKDVRFD
jgi:hypothetical protein